MADLGKGDWVECVDNSPRFYATTPTRLVLGAIYRVRAVFSDPVLGDGIELEGVASAGFGNSFHADRFRPIYRPKSELIDFLKQPAPERELQDV